jgi:hypothetical protein
MNQNPYYVVEELFPNAEALQNLLNKQYNYGYKVVSILPGPGSKTTVVFVWRDAVANLRDATVPSESPALQKNRQETQLGWGQPDRQ